MKAGESSLNVIKIGFELEEVGLNAPADVAESIAVTKGVLSSPRPLKTVHNNKDL